MVFLLRRLYQLFNRGFLFTHLRCSVTFAECCLTTWTSRRCKSSEELVQRAVIVGAHAREGFPRHCRSGILAAATLEARDERLAIGKFEKRTAWRRCQIWRSEPDFRISARHKPWLHIEAPGKFRT